MVLGEEEEEGEGDTHAQEEGEDAAALFGSHGPKYGGGCDLLYDQFELHSPVAKKHQIVLLQECVHCIKETFNKEFEEVVRLKQAEISRIREKNVRILKIVHQLQLDEELVQPTLYPEEQPEGMLTVQDREVKVEKYLSPEEKKKQEEAAKLEEEKRLAEMGDNPRERALDMMMGGRLEANVEEDLFKDLPRPDFMLKEPAEMSEEEIRAAREFEKKEAEFLEEREKLKKALEGELRKLQSTITQAMENFNERLQKLFQLKINTEMAVHQEELKMVGLVSALQVEEEVRGREEQLNTLLKNKKTMKAQLSSVISSAKHTVKECRDQYEHMLAEDKDLERAFKRDFADCEPYVDQLYKLFKRRPRGQKLKPGPSEGGLVSDPKSQNPFPQRPPSAVGGGQKLATRGSGEDAMTELDRESHMPDGVEASQWERLVAARRRKWDSETKVKVVALNLADMEAFLKRRLVEEERVQQEIQDAFRELNRLGEDKTLFNLDLQVQLLPKQGQVEIDEGDFVPDYSGSVLVHRRVIEELNKEIKTHGEAKLASMTECKDFKRGIRMLEWECRRLQMEGEDMQERARDVQLLRVTKDLQLRLNEEGQARRDQHDAETLEKTLELNEKTHKKKVREKKRQLTKLQAQGKKRREENRELDRSLMDRQVSVLERQATETLAGIPPSEAGVRQRMADIVGRRRHVELARAQAAEINLLRSELERLRMATFPALVQVD